MARPEAIDEHPPDEGPAAIDETLAALRTNAIHARVAAEGNSATDALAYAQTVKELALALQALQIRIHN